MDATRPDNPERWGWHLHPVSTLETDAIWQPSRQHIGWLDGGDVYLQPGAAYAAARALAQAEGTDIGLQPMALWKRLHQNGLLASRERDRNVVHRWIGGREYGVLHLHAKTLEDSSAPKSEKSEKSEEQGVRVGEPLAAARPERSAAGHHADFSDFSDFSDIGAQSAEITCEGGHPLRSVGSVSLGPVQNGSHDPHASPPQASCAKGHRDWVLASSGLEQGTPRRYAHVCCTCLSEDEYGAWLPERCAECGVYLKVRDRAGPCPGCGSGGGVDGADEELSNDEMEELRV
jgi:hypothetical protein